MLAAELVECPPSEPQVAESVVRAAKSCFLDSALAHGKQSTCMNTSGQWALVSSPVASLELTHIPADKFLKN